MANVTPEAVDAIRTHAIRARDNCNPTWTAQITTWNERIALCDTITDLREQLREAQDENRQDLQVARGMVEINGALQEEIRHLTAALRAMYLPGEEADIAAIQKWSEGREAEIRRLTTMLRYAKPALLRAALQLGVGLAYDEQNVSDAATLRALAETEGESDG